MFGPLFSDGRRMLLSGYEETNLAKVRSVPPARVTLAYAAPLASTSNRVNLTCAHRTT
jgi:hypothetical protein